MPSCQIEPTKSGSDSQIREWAEAGENLDVYQVNAIFEGGGDYKIVLMSYWKTMACIGLQTFGIITLMNLQWDAAGYNCPDAQICDGDFSQEAWIAFFFAMFVAIACGEQLRTLGNYGMYVLGSLHIFVYILHLYIHCERYAFGSDQPASVSKLWVAVGLWTNTLVLLLTWICSTLTIMTSKGIDVIVLNSVAVLFMITLDDEIVSFSDYSQVTMSLGQAQMNRFCAACGIVGTILLKLQIIWRIPYFCSLLIFPFVVIIPLCVLGCYNADTFIDPISCEQQSFSAIEASLPP